MKKFKELKKITPKPFEEDKPCPYCKSFGTKMKDCKGYKCWER